MVICVLCAADVRFTWKVKGFFELSFFEWRLLPFTFSLFDTYFFVSDLQRL